MERRSQTDRNDARRDHPSLTQASHSQPPSRNYDQVMADINRQQYEDYIARFKPSEDKLLSLAMNDDLLSDQLERNTETINRQFESSNQANAFRSGRLGLSDAKTQQQSTSSNLQKALSLSSVQNETRQAVSDLQNQLITGASGSSDVRG